MSIDWDDDEHEEWARQQLAHSDNLTPTRPNGRVFYEAENRLMWYDEETEIVRHTIHFLPDDQGRPSFHGTALIPDSCDYISYKLYPFDQGEELTLEEIGLDVGELVELESGVNDNDVFVVIVNSTMSITIAANVYSVTINGVASGFTDTTGSFQLGDGETTGYLYNGKDVVIENRGDVSSVVVIVID